MATPSTPTSPNPKTNPDGTANPNYDPSKDPYGNPYANPYLKPDGTLNPDYNPLLNPDGSPKSGGQPQAQFELPAFCTWAKPVCDVIEWMTKPADTPAQTPVTVDTTLPDLPEIGSGAFSINAQCPADITESVTVAGQGIQLSFSYTPLCNLLTSIRPFVIGSSYISAAYICLGMGRGKD